MTIHQRPVQTTQASETDIYRERERKRERERERERERKKEREYLSDKVIESLGACIHHLRILCTVAIRHWIISCAMR